MATVTSAGSGALKTGDVAAKKIPPKPPSSPPPASSTKPAPQGNPAPRSSARRKTRNSGGPKMPRYSGFNNLGGDNAKIFGLILVLAGVALMYSAIKDVSIPTTIKDLLAGKSITKGDKGDTGSTTGDKPKPKGGTVKQSPGAGGSTPIPAPGSPGTGGGGGIVHPL